MRFSGAIPEQMRTNIKRSQHVILIGTNRYAERTQPDSKTNVREELNLALAEAKHNIHFLLPLMLEGDYGTTFPSISSYLIRDGRSWYALDNGQWQFEKFIKESTQYEKSIGIIPCLLGLNRNDDYPEYREECLKDYKKHWRGFIAELELLKIKKLKEMKISQQILTSQNPFILLLKQK